jgi:hypothetical protein
VCVFPHLWQNQQAYGELCVLFSVQFSLLPKLWLWFEQPRKRYALKNLMFGKMHVLLLNSKPLIFLGSESPFAELTKSSQQLIRIDFVAL